MAAEFPGASNLDELWSLLQAGLNTVSKIPNERFDVSSYADPSQHPGRAMNATHGNFCQDVDAFDNAFFHVSPREAKSMDPQQRLLLRGAYNALENAGYVPSSTPSFDPKTFATYIGAATNDYVQNLRNNIDVYYSTGTLPSFLSGKISYAFGFGGPSMVLDTACSASFVAIHQACRALASGDCNAALAGGVNTIASPDMYLGLARGHFLSTTGQCRTWDASADGYCRSEGCGLFVLKRLSDAIAENDRIVGVIRGVEINQSTHPRSITHPHIPSQVSLFKKLVASTAVRPEDIHVVECHGTGTQAGDPAELEAIRTVFAAGRSSDNPLHITSVKANIGHAEAASGAASLAKVLLMMREKVIPKQVGFSQLNPRIPDLASDNVRINTSAAPWASEGTRYAILNNFGASGSNAVLLLEEPSAAPRRAEGLPQTGFVVGLSCRSVEAAERRRADYIALLEKSCHDHASLQDVAYSATARRQLHKFRIAASGATKEEVLKSIRTAKVVEASPAERVVFVFSGQGSQYFGMGADIYRELPALARFVDDCDRRLVGMGFAGVSDVFRPSSAADASADRPDDFEATQSALFVLELAIASLWTSWGVQPCAVIGHSFGEFAALVSAGVLTLEDGLRLVATRARLIAGKCIRGVTTMTAVRASADNIKPILESLSDLEVCCYNTPSHCTVGGNKEQLTEFERLCAGKGMQCTRLDVPYAYHSDAMNPVLEGLREFGQDITFSPPTIPVLSNVTGAVVRPGDTTPFTPDYFSRHCREPARFQQGLADLESYIDVSTVAACIEIGPHPTTLSFLRGLQQQGSPLLFPVLRRKTPGFEIFSAALAQLYNTSVPVQWRKVFADFAPDARLLDLPQYPFAKTRFWVPYAEEAQPTKDARSALLEGHRDPDPLSVAPAPSLSRNEPIVFDKDIASFADLIQGHCVAGVALCPASVYTELALSAVIAVLQDRAEWESTDMVELSDNLYLKPLVYTPGKHAKLRVEIDPSERGVGSFSVLSVEDRTTQSQIHCTGSYKKKRADTALSKLAYAQSMLEREIQAVLANPSETFGTRTCYDLLFPQVVTYSKAFHSIKTIAIHSARGAAYAVVQLPRSKPTLAGPVVLDPIFADTLLHVAGFFLNFTYGMNGREACICSQVDKVKLLHELFDPTAQYGVYTSVVLAEENVVVADVYALELDDPRRRVIACLKRVRFRKVPMASLTRILKATAGRSSVVHSAPASAPMKTSPRPTKTAPAASPPQRQGAPAPAAKESEDLQDDVIDIISETSGLGRKDIAMDAQLSHLGIDSLMIWELVSRLRAILPEDAVDTHTLASASTVKDLVHIVNDKRGARSETASTAATVYDTDGSTSDAESLPDLKKSAKLGGSNHGATTRARGASGRDTVKAVLATVLDVPVSQVADSAELESLGLDSLSTIEARHAFETQLGVRLDEASLMACRTVEDLVKAVSALQVSSDSSADSPLSPSRSPAPPAQDLPPQMRPELIRLQTAPAGRAQRPPLILLHDGSGLIGGYTKLGSLGCDVWAIQNSSYATTPSLVEAQRGKEVATMAMSYVGLLTKTLFWDGEAFRGDCLIGGWSFGGVLAFDIARRLRSLGVQVKGLILIDSPAPQSCSPLDDSLIDAVMRQSATKSGASQRTMELVQAQMRYATRALVAYDPSQTQRAAEGDPPAVFLRSRDAVHVEPGVEQLVSDRRVQAFLTKRDDDTVAKWEEALGRRIAVMEIPGSHFTPFEDENVSNVYTLRLDPLELTVWLAGRNRRGASEGWCGVSAHWAIIINVLIGRVVLEMYQYRIYCFDCAKPERDALLVNELRSDLRLLVI
ncbi:ketoacyl-synt-domain-containing protein [Daedaleopsis nitida]|nr:ketoacyl-synt-domain-containing protein [Daedaleopsis nitida]